jgi:homoserine dehydrogenase
MSDAFRTSGSSPGISRVRTCDTVHLVGPGAVGRALLRRLAGSRRRLIAVSDSTATLADPAGLDPLAVAAWKERGRPLREHPHARVLDTAEAVRVVDAGILVDTTSTDLNRRGWTDALHTALERGACLGLAAKGALCEAAGEWLNGPHRARVGCNAVLGGTGRDFAAELPELRRHWRSVAIVGNASTTAIIEAVERGATLQDEAQALGYLEPDPEQDLQGADAAVKLAIVAGALTRRRIDPRSICPEDIRVLDRSVVRGRAQRGATTRLVARLTPNGRLGVAYEEVSRDSLLAAPCGRVVYEYRLKRSERRLHVGEGLGAEATAAALWLDVSSAGARAHAGAAQPALAVHQ